MHSPDSTFSLLAFLPELFLLTGTLALFFISLGTNLVTAARQISLATGAAFVLATIFTFRVEATLFDGAYQVDAYSQWLKVVFGLGYLAVTVLCHKLSDIRPDVRPEFLFLLASAVCGFVFLSSSVDLITIVVALELSSFPLFLMVAMRREEHGRRFQMESAVKFMMFGIGASGFMLFGMGYLYGLTGTTSLPVLMERIIPLLDNPIAIMGLAMTMAAFFYKLAVFPFHFWTPDVYEGASNETTGIIASLPKVAAVLLLVRFVILASPGQPTIAAILAALAIASMFYGNLLALVQSDFKRLLGFSTIAHAGYALLGMVALNEAGMTAALYYITGYMFMVLACFFVIVRAASDGANLPISALAGLHRRSPLLAATLLAGVFSLAGIPPFVGFMGKFSLLSAAFEAGYGWLVLLAVLNTVIAVYYYLRVIVVAFFTEASSDAKPIFLDPTTRVVCLALILIVLALGIVPGLFVDTIASSLPLGPWHGQVP